MPEHPLCAVTRSTRVIEHFADLGAEAGQDRGLEESVKTGKAIFYINAAYIKMVIIQKVIEC